MCFWSFEKCTRKSYTINPLDAMQTDLGQRKITEQRFSILHYIKKKVSNPEDTE